MRPAFLLQIVTFYITYRYILFIQKNHVNQLFYRWKFKVTVRPDCLIICDLGHFKNLG